MFLISKILTCFFLFQVIQQCDMLYLDCYWISCELAKISMVEKLISKELVNSYGLYDNSLLMGAPPHTAGVRPIKVASYGCFSIQNKSKSTSHQSPVTSHRSFIVSFTRHQSPGIQAWIKSPGISYQSPVIQSPVIQARIKSPGIYHGY